MTAYRAGAGLVGACVFSITLRAMVLAAVSASLQALGMWDGGSRKPYRPRSWSSNVKEYLMPRLYAQSSEPPGAKSGEQTLRVTSIYFWLIQVKIHFLFKTSLTYISSLLRNHIDSCSYNIFEFSGQLLGPSQALNREHPHNHPDRTLRVCL